VAGLLEGVAHAQLLEGLRPVGPRDVGEDAGGQDESGSEKDLRRTSGHHHGESGSCFAIGAGRGVVPPGPCDALAGRARGAEGAGFGALSATGGGGSSAADGSLLGAAGTGASATIAAGRVDGDAGARGAGDDGATAVAFGPPEKSVNASTMTSAAPLPIATATRSRRTCARRASRPTAACVSAAAPRATGSSPVRCRAIPG